MARTVNDYLQSMHGTYRSEINCHINTRVQWWQENTVWGAGKTTHSENDIIKYLACMQICKWQCCIWVADFVCVCVCVCNEGVAYGSSRLFVGDSYTQGNTYSWNCRGSRNPNRRLMLSSWNDKMKFGVGEFCFGVCLYLIWGKKWRRKMINCCKFVKIKTNKTAENMLL